MDKKVKLAILSIVAILIVGIFVGKKVYEKNEQSIEGDTQIHLTSLDETKEGIPTIMMFKSSTCQYCVQMEKKLEEIYKVYPEKFNLVYIMVDDNSKENEENINLANTYKVRVVPTTIFMDSNGVGQYRVEGLMQDEDILKILKEFGVE